MSSAQIQALLSPPNANDSARRATEALNKQFTTIEDLHVLDVLVAEADDRNRAAQAKASTSQLETDELVSATRGAAQRHHQEAHELSIQRHSLAEELADVSRALLSENYGEGREPSLMEDLETMHRSLKELESVKDYVLVLDNALRLSEAALRQSHADAPVSSDLLKGYKALQDYVASVVQSLSKIQDESTGQTLSLVSFLERIRDKTWLDIRTYFFNKLIDAAEKIGWPAPVEYLASSAQDRRAFEIAFMSLLKLQLLSKKFNGTNIDKEGLYPLQAMAQAVSLRFKFHFEGSRPTNKIDKPEWYFNHIQNVSHEHKAFMTTIVQDLLDRTDFRSFSAWREFTYLLLPILTRKIRKSVPQILEHPSLLAHTIYEALAFDAAVTEDEFSLDGTSAPNPEDKWNGISEVILGNADWFEAWLSGEQSFVEDQYNDIISAPDAWLVSEDGEDGLDSRGLRPTNSARKIKSLIEQVTDRYSSLPHAAQRAHFLVKIQVPLLDAYHGRISSSLDAFETLSSVFIRAVPGALAANMRGQVTQQMDARNLTSGSAGVNRLSKALLSATYLRAALEGWSDDVFFIQLWSEFSRNDALRHWAGAVPILPTPPPPETDDPGSVFSIITERYRTLCTRAEEMIVQLVCGEVENGLRAHLNSQSTSATPADLLDMAVSQTLLVPITALSTHLGALRGVVPRTIMTTLYRRIAKRIADFVFHQQIMYRGSFSLFEGRVIFSEVELWVETCCAAAEAALGGGRQRVQAPWTKTLQAARLVSLDGEEWQKVKDLTFGAQGDAQWEDGLADLLGSPELARDDVGTLLRRRQ